MVMDRITSKNLREAVVEHVEEKSFVMTDAASQAVKILYTFSPDKVFILAISRI